MAISHAAERKAASVAIRQALKYIKKTALTKASRSVELIDLTKKFMGGAFSDEGIEDAKKMMADPDNKWSRYITKALDELDDNVIVNTLLDLDSNRSSTAPRKSRKNREKYDCNIPWLILMDPTSACNLHCTGCWAAEYGHKLNLTYDKMDSIIQQGKDLRNTFLSFYGRRTACA